MTRRLDTFIRLKRDPSGSTAVEFAFIMPLFLAMIFGIVEFGRLLWIRNSMEMAAEQAARYGAINSSASPEDIQTQALTYLIGVDPATITFDASASTSSLSSITATHDFTTVAAYFIPALTSKPLTVTATFPR